MTRRFLRCRAAQFLGALIARAGEQRLFVREIGAVEHLQHAGASDRPELTAERAYTPDNALAAIGMGHERSRLYHTSALFAVGENPYHSTLSPFQGEGIRFDSLAWLPHR